VGTAHRFPVYDRESAEFAGKLDKLWAPNPLGRNDRRQPTPNSRKLMFAKAGVAGSNPAGGTV
jgi:hypothetical protein